MEEFPNIKISKQDRSFLHLAMKMAETSECEQKHGAVIVKSGRVLALGNNKWRNRPTEGAVLNNEDMKNMTVHAEVDALSRVKNAHGAVIYVARVNGHGEPKMSRPCDNCYKAIKMAGLKRIIYTTDSF